MCADFCMKLHTNVNQRNVHFTTEFCSITAENDKIMLFRWRKPPISDLASRAFTVAGPQV